MLDKWNQLNKKQRMTLIGIAAGVLLAIVIIIGIAVAISSERSGLVSGTSEGFSSEQTETDSNTEVSQMTETASAEDVVTEQETSSETQEPSESESEAKIQEDPQGSMEGNMNEGSGANVEIGEVLENLPNENETLEITYGIDVSKYQGAIDWKQVAESGIDFAMIRVGYRTLKTGEIIADNNAKYNMQEAAKYGIKVGVYFFSTAVTREEAIEEADWVSDYISKYQITYPVVYNC